MNYKYEIQKFITSQYIYSGVRIALAIVVPSIILAYFGLLKEYFLFPLGTSFIGLTDMAGPYHRRRNALILAMVCFMVVATIATLLKGMLLLVFLEIIIFGIFFSMLGVYGQRFAAVGGLTLVVFSIFIDGHLSGNQLIKSILVFTAGCLWFIIIFMIVSKLQPYKLAGQMIGENYVQLADYLRIKSKFYKKDSNPEYLYPQVIAKQVVIKNLQEETREVVFKTRKIVNESTTVSRLLMLMFLNSIDFYEKLITSDQDYKKIHENFDDTTILNDIHDYLITLADEITHIGIALQSGTKAKPLRAYHQELQEVYQKYFELRNREMSAENLENFLGLRLILLRVTEITDEVKTFYRIQTQNEKSVKSLSSGLDYEKFLPKQEKLNSKVFFQNFSLKSSHFRHAVRITVALLLGYAISKLQFLGIGHSYWILITTIAIMRPAYSTTKHRNMLRLYGTAFGAVTAYLLLVFVHHDTVLLTILFTSMILCFALLKDHYAWAVFFMTIYIFITFNFLNPGNVNLIFKDRILDTIIAGIISFVCAYFVLPVWERTQTKALITKSLTSNKNYFDLIIQKFQHKIYNEQEYKMVRKDAIINLANVSDNFQKMLSDPKNQQRAMEQLHQLVTTTHLSTAYIAALSQYSSSKNNFEEINFAAWREKITSEMQQTVNIITLENKETEQFKETNVNSYDLVDELLIKRKSEIEENEFFDTRDAHKVTALTELNSIKEILELLYDVVKEQKKIAQNLDLEH